MIRSPGRATFEIAAVVVTGLLKFLMVDFLSLKFIYVMGAVLSWAAYIIYRRKKDVAALQRWGFTSKNFAAAWKRCAWFGLSCIAVMAIYGTFTGNLFLHWHMIPILLLYPAWGIIQQFLMMGLIAGNMERLEKKKLGIVLFTSFMFSIVHYPSWLLVAGTFGLAVFYTLLFLRYKNLWPLGLFHGWIGCFFFFWVLDRDPWMEFIGMIGT